ncbi:MAG: TIGR02206 family membrane protein [Elainellaceae cyanobacterium]
MFRPFSLTHFVTVGLLIAIWIRVISWGLRRQGTQRLIQREKQFASAYLLVWVAFHGWRLLPPNFDPARSLPIHICDLAALLVPLALIWRRRYLVALLYFWGLGFSLQGLITPDLNAGIGSPWFWLFWLHHATIVGAALYIVIVHQFRPTRKDYRWAVRAGLCYLAFVFPLNAVFGFNYGYLGNLRSSQPSLLDWLGPWPWRVLAMVALAWLGMALLLAP